MCELIKRSITVLLSLLVTLVAACGGSGAGGVAVAPPNGLYYSGASVVYVLGLEIIPSTPAASAVAITQYSVSPALPAGLVLNPQTGVISGTPSAVTPATLYTVTGSNSAGSATARLQIEVKDKAIAPDALSYPDNPIIYAAAMTIVPNAPVTSGGAITQYGVTPALPAGLVLNAQTGVISGMPTAVSAATEYTVTGGNSAGGISTILNIAVQARVMPPASLTYSDPEPVYTVGQPVVENVLQTTGGDVTRYTVSPALPAGLGMDVLTGIISGTPENAQASAVYTLTGSNSAGRVSTAVEIAVQSGPSGIWLPGDSMSRTRIAHTATVLASGPNAGKVLVTGGDNLKNSAELYDPIAGTWSPTGSMKQARDFFTASVLTVGPNAGKVLVAGGAGNGDLDSAELYDSATGTWSKTGSMNQMRAAHAATVLSTGPNAGKVLVAGGYTDGYLNSAELYDPVAGTWSPTGSMGLGRYLFTATELTVGPNAGKVLVAGGSTNGYRNSAELYDPTTGTWSPTGSMNEARAGHTATVLTTGPNAGKVLVAGGSTNGYRNSAELYDPVAGTWSPTGSMSLGRYLFTATELTTGPNAGKVLVAGGAAGGSSAELYDPVGGSWSTTGSMNQRRQYHTATELKIGPNAGKVLVAGGSGAGSSVEMYVP
ncbi:putative Ig domain-containing protein [Caballeronia sp. EK]|uniref:kelch repeat-containing protein n=1 Tax=Caballeronia sp. EK TaxID=2767469 RepID=UPI00165671EE|nr:kelch repeat-containing protein [Caballeronia sp. EK]MBC8643007.1 putative Ig domain-containing protein [Caballeronia sp. EK]